MGFGAKLREAVGRSPHKTTMSEMQLIGMLAREDAITEKDLKKAADKMATNAGKKPGTPEHSALSKKFFDNIKSKKKDDDDKDEETIPEKGAVPPQFQKGKKKNGKDKDDDDDKDNNKGDKKNGDKDDKNGDKGGKDKDDKGKKKPPKKKDNGDDGDDDDDDENTNKKDKKKVVSAKEMIERAMRGEPVEDVVKEADLEEYTSEFDLARFIRDSLKSAPAWAALRIDTDPKSGRGGTAFAVEYQGEIFDVLVTSQM